MKLITFVVPSYNSQDYMRVCIDSLLKGGEDVEIIIVDDGSKDDTGKIADEYVAKYPTICKVVHQENGGHGAGIAAGIENATGKFFKVVDSDDWVLEESLHKIIERIKEDGDKVDLYVTDYTYYQGTEPKTTITYKDAFPVGKIVTWNETNHLKIDEYLTIHASMYRTEVIRKSNLNLPRHTFYEDDYFVYSPLCNVETICYLGYSFYCYFVGRPGQSVQKDIAISRYQDYQRVGVLCMKQFNPYDYKGNKKKFKLIYHHLRMFVGLGIVHCNLFRKKDFKDNPKKNMLDPIKDMKQYKKDLKAANPKLYRKFRFRSPLCFLFWVRPFGSLNSKISYDIAHKMVKFN